MALPRVEAGCQRQDKFHDGTGGGLWETAQTPGGAVCGLLRPQPFRAPAAAGTKIRVVKRPYAIRKEGRRDDSM